MGLRGWLPTTLMDSTVRTTSPPRVSRGCSMFSRFKVSLGRRVRRRSKRYEATMKDRDRNEPKGPNDAAQ
jgi:hypothetical protein